MIARERKREIKEGGYGGENTPRNKSGVSKWKRAGVWRKSRGIAEERERRETLVFIHTQHGCSFHPLQP